MEQSQYLGAFYLFGIALNLVALVYAIQTGQTAFAVAFVLVVLYLSFRYRTREQFVGGPDDE
ncbi:hypothetical protein [Natronobeatus ordinarius]|uniref:hypothetical protein n=1 Tax=Natronobeatus ordinarius TaxID=2963433 RepID=UPI0020CD8227|nr:hypothetical protein [Natronobeatus ordinarius]